MSSQSRQRSLLFWYISRQLWGNFIIWAAVLSVIFLIAHYLITLRFLLPGLISARLLCYLMPQLIMHALPLAALLAVGMTWQRAAYEREIIFFQYFSRAQQQVATAIGVMAFGAAVALTLFAGWLGPYWYSHAKQELVASFSRVARTIPPRKRIRILPHVYVWYDARVAPRQWGQARFCLAQQSGRTLLMSAKRVILGESSFILKNGSVTEHRAQRLVQHQFEQMVVPYDEYEVAQKPSLRAKHQTFSRLWARTDRSAQREKARRFAHIILLLFLVMMITLWVRRYPFTTFLQLLIIATLLFVFQQFASVAVSFCF